VLCAGRGRRDTLDLCDECLGVLPIAVSGCARCAALAPGPCARCAIDPPPYSACHAAYRYATPIDALVRALKYGKRLTVARVLGELLAASVQRAGLHCELLLPVPLHPSRQAARGFNQALEITRWTARRLQLPWEPRGAVRRSAGPPQALSSGAERRRNLRDAFAADSARIAGRHLAIVDDVLTTGSTAGSLATALLRAGASRVDVWCVAIAATHADPAGPQRNT
jgi:ComF family protein